MECDQLLPAEPGRGGHPHGHLQLHLLLHLHAGQADMAAMFNNVDPVDRKEETPTRTYSLVGENT